jgi:ABC-2 type transport system permease protein
MIGRLLWLEIVRMLRDPKYLALAVAAPIGFYLLFATIFGGGRTAPGQLPAVIEIAVAMAAFGSIWSAISTTGPRLAEERQIGWMQQLRSMPVPGWTVLLAKVVASVITALPSVVLVCVVAVLAKGASLTVGQWTAVVVATWLGSLTFSLLGVLLGLVLPGEAAYPASYGLYLAGSAVGGLWVPPSVLPSGMHDVAVWLPTYNLANLGWTIAAGDALPWASVGNLAGWATLFAMGALLAYCRPTRTRRASAVAVTIPA